MRHLKKGKKFGLKKGQRRAFMKILANNLVMKEKIRTTEVRAKALRPEVERMVTHAKKRNVAALRMLMEKLPKEAAYKLYHEIAPRYDDRKGGYTRIVKHLKLRKNDASKMATISFV
ncbi:MAG: 50S ribosomal protein L17 [Candidatus Jorgensenbacteria bacterium GW2011_GWA2_45_13]|uniref:50S ribosomal protein L17 n=1 Tax=Candidatus Jorgensenbacteria bacterium GW2011_GWA2_45_13 TaxID=1618662 RepID=A0A0G1P430_9BACT|nr:MAG: 50S ribosomal protein L17 [Candidatus Jorgensenbacteria bacterium GW2011_GWA2_45_13]